MRAALPVVLPTTFTPWYLSIAVIILVIVDLPLMPFTLMRIGIFSTVLLCLCFSIIPSTRNVTAQTENSMYTGKNFNLIPPIAGKRA